MAKDWKQKQIEAESILFKWLFEDWAKEIKEQTGRKGTRGLFAFLIHHPRGEKPFFSEDPEEIRLSKECWKNNEDCWEAMRRHNFKSEPHNQNSVGKWLNGEVLISPAHKKQICQICGVSEDYFEEDTIGDFSLEYSDRARRKKADQLKKYSQQINLSEDFIKYVTSLKDISRLFPFHCESDPSSSSTETMFEISDSEEHTFFLSETDLDYLKELQEDIKTQIREYVELRLLKEKQEIQREKERLFIRQSLKDHSSEEHFEEILESIFRARDISNNTDINKYNLLHNDNRSIEEIYCAHRNTFEQGA